MNDVVTDETRQKALNEPIKKPLPSTEESWDKLYEIYHDVNYKLLDGFTGDAAHDKQLLKDTIKAIGKIQMILGEASPYSLLSLPNLPLV